MKKLFTLFLALVASVGMTFAARDVVPSDAVLKNYYKTGQLCVCIFVPAEMACNDVVFVGTYNRDASGAWIIDVNKLAKFQPVEGYDGWYVIAVNDETPADYESKGIQGKPIVLDQNGAFNWQYQVSAATKIRGGVEIVSGAYIDEIDLIRYTKDTPNVYTIDALKGGNPCTSEDSSTISGTCGDNLRWTLSNGTLTISGTGAMIDYNSYSPWYYYRSSIKSIVIDDGVTSIGIGAFAYCSSLTSITIPNSVTSIGDNAFYDCSSLTSITIPNSVTSIGYSAFYNCDSLTSVTLTASSEEDFCKGQGNSLLYSEGVRCQREIQINGTKVTKFTIPNSVTSIGYDAFNGCSSLTSVTIGNNVTNIGYSAFNDCLSLTSVHITDIAAWCNIYFGSESANPLYYAHNLYLNGNLVKDLVIPNSVTSIGIGAFENCSSLTSVTIPNSVTSIGWGAFSGCSSLTSVTIPNSVTSIGEDAFGGCSNITSVRWNAKNCNSYNFGSQVTSFEFGDEVEVIPSSLCKGMEKLTSITIPNSVTSIGFRAFAYCSSLTSITIPNSVTSIGDNAFEGTGIYANEDNWENDVLYINDCLISAKESISGAYTIKAGTRLIADGAFAYCSSLTSITIPNSVTSIGDNAFYYDSSLTSMTIPNSVTSIGIGAFAGCSSLTSMTIPNSVTSIGEEAFYGCDKLVDVYCYATTPPATEGDDTFSHYNAFLYVPCESKKAYMVDAVWGNFKYIECIESDNVTTDEIVVTPSENEANVIWPSVNGAASYELVIKDKNGNIVCTLIFNANGQLTSIAFNAPSRNGVPAQTQSAGFSFTITGLDSGTGYDLTLTAKDNSGNIIEETTIPFQTNKPEGIEDVQSDEVQSTKVIKDGQVLILRNGKTYTMQGQEVK